MSTARLHAFLHIRPFTCRKFDAITEFEELWPRHINYYYILAVVAYSYLHTGDKAVLLVIIKLQELWLRHIDYFYILVVIAYGYFTF